MHRPTARPRRFTARCREARLRSSRPRAAEKFCLSGSGASGIPATMRLLTNVELNAMVSCCPGVPSDHPSPRHCSRRSYHRASSPHSPPVEEDRLPRWVSSVLS